MDNNKNALVNYYKCYKNKKFQNRSIFKYYEIMISKMYCLSLFFIHVYHNFSFVRHLPLVLFYIYNKFI